MIFILEGPDSAGKTTLARMLKELYKSDYLHFEFEPDDEKYKEHLNITFELLNFYAGSLNRHIILDRYISSERVYAQVYREGNVRTTEDDFKKMILQADSIIFCLPQNKQQYLDHFEKIKKERKEMYEDRMDDVYLAYQDEYVTCLNEAIRTVARPNKVMRYDFFNVI